MGYNIPPLDSLIEQFERLPGIGKKSAQRLAFYVLSRFLDPNMKIKPERRE